MGAGNITRIGGYVYKGRETAGRPILRIAIGMCVLVLEPTSLAIELCAGVHRKPHMLDHCFVR